MGKISGKEDKDCGTRSEEKRLYGHPHSRGGTNIRVEGGHYGNKPERVNRAIRQGIDEGSASRRGSGAGGILRQLISSGLDRLAKLEEQHKAQLDEIQLLQSALQRLESISDQT